MRKNCICISSVARYRCRNATLMGCELDVVEIIKPVITPAMSKFSEISKSVNLMSKDVKWPSENEARELESKVLKGDEEAFMEVFRIHRFAASPRSVAEKLSSNIIWNAFKEGAKMISDEA